MNTSSLPKLFYFVLYFLLQYPNILFGQDVISLKDLLSQSIEHSPVQNNFILIEKNQSQMDRIYQSSKYPQVNLIAQGTYQSDVVTFPDNPALAFPVIPKGQYRTYLEASQVIFNGGRSKSVYEMENTGNSILEFESQNTLNEIENRVEGLYFNGLLLQKRK
ncbi:MAG: TolC family protein, partial [Cyclobacteriaceae bacterium]|nr:TolC family protein [Cyclobacteriaceae bacterium]